MNNKTLLKMKNIHKKFPGVYALKNVDFELMSGEVHALLGENGAGKSTLIKVLGGIYEANEGDIYIEENQVYIQNVLQAHQNGIAIIHQELVLVPYMTVAENIFLGREPMKKLFVDKDKMFSDTKNLLDEYSLKFKPNTLVRNLSIAQQQMVEIIKAISFNSKILVMDEPTSSISEKDVEFLFSIMRTLVSKGVGIIYISHKMSDLNDVCDRVTVLRDGEYVGTKKVKETNRDELVNMMVGRKLSSYYTRNYLEPGKTVLSCNNLCDYHMVKDVSFEVKEREIIGFAGLVGAGRSETVKAIFGLTKEYEGEIAFLGDKKHYTSAQNAMKDGISLVPEDRKKEGLYLIQSVEYNTTIQVLSEFIKGIRLNKKKEAEITQKYIDLMDTKTPSVKQVVGNLSGGNQQKVIIGRWLATNPKLLILDEPTRGVDVGAKAEIYSIMNELVKEGLSIIMISSELPEIINMSDRVYVFAHGYVKGCLNRTELTQENIMHLAAE